MIALAFVRKGSTAFTGTKDIEFMVANYALGITIAHQRPYQVNDGNTIRTAIDEVPYKDQTTILGVFSGSVVAHKIEESTQRTILSMNITNDIQISFK